MLEDRPILKDRLMALATFSGIAIAAVSGFELVITGGFDFLSPGAEVREVAPSSYVQVIEVPWSSEGRVVALSSNEYMFAGMDEPASVDSLAGGVDDEGAPDGAYPTGPSPDELSSSIEALYQASGAAEYEPVGEESWGPGYYAEDADMIVKDDSSVSESALPS